MSSVGVTYATPGKKASRVAGSSAWPSTTCQCTFRLNPTEKTTNMTKRGAHKLHGTMLSSNMTSISNPATMLRAEEDAEEQDRVN